MWIETQEHFALVRRRVSDLCYLRVRQTVGVGNFKILRAGHHRFDRVCPIAHLCLDLVNFPLASPTGSKSVGLSFVCAQRMTENLIEAKLLAVLVPGNVVLLFENRAISAIKAKLFAILIPLQY